MYKGKFDQKKKGGSSNVQDILAQRNQPAAPDIPELMPRKAAPQPRPAAQHPAPQQEVPAKAPARKAAPQKAVPQKAVSKAAPSKPQKKGPRLGGVIFYTLYFLFILIFFLAVLVGMIYLKGWLVDFEAAQPTVKSEQVFTQLFTTPDWGALYDAAGAKDSPFEGKTQFITYMQDKIGSEKLNFIKTSAGLSGGMKFNVRLGTEKVATFTLVDKNKVGDSTLDKIKKLPDWELGSVEVFFERNGSYRIQKMADHTAYVNDVPLDDSYTIQKATTKAEEYLPAGVTSASTYLQEVTGLMQKPTVTVFDKAGNEVAVTYDEDTRTFTARTESNTASDPEQEETALKAAETYSLYMLEKASRADVAKYYDNTSNAYKNLPTDKLWVQKNDGHEFVDEKVSEFARYSDDIFSARVSMTVKVTRKDGSPKEFPVDMTMFFHKTESGKWKVYETTNKDVSAPVGKVRLTFMNGQDVVNSDFYETDAPYIITPLLPVPEGKVFSGWVRRDVDENGDVTLVLMFQPDETGKVMLSEGTNLLPMTLEALFEDPGSATVSAETPAETPAETSPTEEVSE